MSKILDKILRRRYILPDEELDPSLDPKKIQEAKAWTSEMETRTKRTQREFYRYRLELALEGKRSDIGERPK